MRRLILIALVLFPAAALQAQQRLHIDVPESVAAKATETVDITLDGAMLRLATKFLSQDGDERAARDLVEKLEGIYVKSYEFSQSGAYDHAILDSIRAQLGPTWKRMVQVKSRMREDTDIYIDVRGERVVGLLVLAAEPRELTIVNLVGPIDLDRLADLEGHFGIPRMTAGSGKKDKSDE